MMSFLGGRAGDAGGLEQRLRQIERKLDLILDHLGLKLADDGLAEVRALVAQGQKILAIKRYRELTGAGLKEAKDAVEAGL